MKLDYSRWMADWGRGYWMAGVVGIVLAVALGVWLFSPEMVMSHRDEIDIRSGRIRRSERFLFFRTQTKVSELASVSPCLRGFSFVAVPWFPHPFDHHTVIPSS